MTLFKKNGQAFEDLFTDVAKHEWGPDFEPWKPQGPLGDFKCDGYLVSRKTVFQCHAPEQPNPSVTKTKILKDFAGAKEHFGDGMKCWIFVYNQRELPAGCADVLRELRRQNNEIDIKLWVHHDIIEFAMSLDPNKLAVVFPELLNVENDELVEKQKNGAVGLSIMEPQVDQDDANLLSQKLEAMSQTDREIRRLILGYSVWLDPMPTARAIELLVDKGHAEPEVNLNLDRLHQEGLVQITAAHILPKDRQVCQEAATSLEEEFIELLGEQ